MKWTEESIRLMTAAADRSCAYAQLADVICQSLPRGSRVLDAGCGLGHLSLELADRGMRVTAVDTSSAALAVLESRIGDRNISVFCGGVETIVPDVPYDAMIFCLFGELDEVLQIARAQCRGDVFIVARRDSVHRFSVRRHALSHAGFDDMCAALDRLGTPHRDTPLSLEIGQPLLDYADARRFFALYNRDNPSLITDDYLRARLVKTDDPKYPLYLPHARQVGVIHFRTADIPDA